MQSADLNAGLLAGAKLGRRELVSLCLDEGADMDAADDKGMTALHLAALYGHHDLVEFLLGRGAAETYKEETDPERLAEQGGAGGPTIINSPLHWAVLRGHLRCIWLLLGAGYSPLDLDQCGNNALHLAAACTCASRATQLVLLRSLMHAGFDPDARNWYGQRAVDLLPTDALEARRLLTAAAETTRCPTTGAPFGANELRYLCASSGAFFSEEASVAVTIRAFAPSLEEAPFSPLHRTGSSGDDDAGGGGGGGPSALAPFGSAGSAGFGLLMVGSGGGGGGGSMVDASFSGAAAGMVDDGDGADGGLRGGGAAGGAGAGAGGGAAGGGSMVVIPARMGADAVYRVADAESALEAALNPFTAALVAAGITPGGGAVNGVGGGGLGAGGPSLGPGAASSLLVGGSLAGSLIGGGGDLSLAPSPEKRGSGVGVSAAAEGKEGSGSARDGKDKDGHHKDRDGKDREREGGEAGMPSARALLQRGMIAAIAEEDEEEDEEEEEEDEDGGGSDDGSRSGGGAGGGGRGRLGRSRADSRGSEDRSEGEGGGDSGGEEGSDGEGESLSRRSATDGGDDAASAGGAGSDMLRQGGSRVTSDSRVTSGSGGGKSGRKRSDKGDGRGAAAAAVSAAAAFAAAQTFVAGLLPELGLPLDATAAAAFGGASAAAAAALNAAGGSMAPIGGALAVGEVDGDAPRLGPDGRQPAEAEPELYLSKEQLKGLQGAASSVQALHGDVTLLTRHAHFLRRVAAARDLADHVAALTAAPARPFPTRAAATKHVGRAIAAAHASGVAATLLQEARLAVAVVAAESELAAAVDVCSRIAVGKHSRDADIARLRAAVAVGKRLNAMVGAAVAARDLPGFVMPKPAEPDMSAAGAGAGMGGRASDAGGGFSGAPSLSHHPKPASLAAGGGAGGPSSDALDAAAGAGSGSSGSAAASSLGPVFRSARLAPSLPTIEDGPGGLLERGEGLLARLACEVGVTDCVDAVSAAMRGLEGAVARHAAEDPAYIPAPELTPEEAAAVQEAAAAHAALLAAPPPKPQPGKKAPPPPPPPPAHPAFPPTRFPLDWNGVPLPQTAQLTALQALQEAVHALGETVASARTSGADEACITGAEAAFATAKAALDVGMDAERERVTNARIERAKTEKKKKGGAKKKK